MNLNSTQILFAAGSSEPLSATGVEIITDGKKWELTGVKKEIVVSCGDYLDTISMKYSRAYSSYTLA